MIISCSPQGLSNRIKSLLNAMRLARRAGEPYGVYWSPTGHTPCRFSSLFENDIEVGRLGLLGHVLRAPAALIGREGTTLVDNHDLIAFDDDFVGEAPHKVDRLYERTPPRVVAAFGELIRELKIAPLLLERALEFARSFDDETFAVVIRSWPDLRDHRRKLHFLHLDFSLDPFIEEIERREGRFYLTSDSQDVVRTLQERFPRRAMVRELGHDHAYPTSEQGVVNGFINMLIASRAPVIVTSRITTYPEVAWWFGGCRAEVVLPEPPVIKTDTRPRWKRQVIGRVFPRIALEGREGSIRKEVLPESE